MFLVHCCCADCTIKLLESIEKENQLQKEEICLFFYNPNIHPRSELLSRQRSFQKLFDKEYKMVIGDWSPREYFVKIREGLGEVKLRIKKEERCKLCWELRLEKSFAYAKANNGEMVSSTLFSSQYQNFPEISKIGTKLEKKYKIKFWVPKKIDKDKESKGFYKQNYCGCCYSLEERMIDKYK